MPWILFKIGGCLVKYVGMLQAMTPATDGHQFGQ